MSTIFRDGEIGGATPSRDPVYYGDISATLNRMRELFGAPVTPEAVTPVYLVNVPTGSDYAQLTVISTAVGFSTRREPDREARWMVSGPDGGQPGFRAVVEAVGKRRPAVAATAAGKAGSDRAQGDQKAR